MMGLYIDVKLRSSVSYVLCCNLRESKHFNFWDIVKYLCVSANIDKEVHRREVFCIAKIEPRDIILNFSSLNVYLFLI